MNELPRSRALLYTIGANRLIGHSIAARVDTARSLLPFHGFVS